MNYRRSKIKIKKRRIIMVDSLNILFYTNDLFLEFSFNLNRY